MLYIQEEDCRFIDSAFCEYRLKTGDIVFVKGNRVFKDRPNEWEYIAISLNDCVDLDLSKSCRQNETYTGLKLSFIKKGTVNFKLSKKWKLPVGQKLYLNKKNKIHWKKSNICIGCTLSKQDKDGFINIDFDGVC